MTSRPAPPPPVELRARRVGEIIDTSFGVVKQNFKTLVPLAGGLVLPFQVIAALLLYSLKPTVSDTLNSWTKALAEDPSARPHFTGKQIAATAGSGIVSYLGGIVVTAALTAFLLDVMLGRLPNRSRAVRTAVRRGPIMILSSIVMATIAALVVLPGFALLVAGQTILAVLAFAAAFPAFIYLIVRLGNASPAIVLEGAGPFRAIKRSWSLTKGRFGPIFGLTILSSLIVAVIAAVVGGVITGLLTLAGGNNKGFAFVWAAIGNTISAAVTTPISAAVAVLLYLDLRVRREAFDIEQLATSMSTSPTNA